MSLALLKTPDPNPTAQISLMSLVLLVPLKARPFLSINRRNGYVALHPVHLALAENSSLSLT
jgi:hypothetical protein